MARKKTSKSSTARGAGTITATGAVSSEDLDKIKYEVGQEIGISNQTEKNKNKKNIKK